jgi:hypothetical protein
LRLTKQVADPYLQADRAVKCVEDILAEFGSRQLIITTEWENWNITRQIEIQLREIMTANMEVLYNLNIYFCSNFKNKF